MTARTPQDHTSRNLARAALSGGIEFTCAFDTDEEARVLLLDADTGAPKGEAVFERLPFRGALRRAFAPGFSKEDTDYLFKVGDRLVIDPRAGRIKGRERFADQTARAPYQVRCAFVSDTFDWGSKEKAPQIPYDRVIAYYLHVRGFTKHRSAKVTGKGTFLGLTRKIRYLQDLGINQVVLMPCYEFEEVETRRGPAPARLEGAPGEDSAAARINYWGYTESCYFAPKAGYSAGPRPDLEFKSMVRALHEAGIEVIMEFAFPDAVGEALALDALRYWTREYHVDGFSLLARPAIAYMAAHDPCLAASKLMTGYFAPDTAYPAGRGRGMRHLANCNDGFKIDMRKVLKGDADMMAAFVERTRQSGRDIACVNYLTCHDGFTLMDLVSYDRKHNEANGEHGQDGAESEFSWNCGVEGPSRKRSVQELRLRQIKNAFALLLLSHGTPMILAGDELGNSQEGNSNPWCIDGPLTWVEWSDRRMAAQIRSFVRELTAFRRAHPLLSREHLPSGKVQISCGYPDFSCHSDRAWFGAYDYQTRHTGLMYCGVENGAETFIYIAYNFHWDPQVFAIPYLPEGLRWERVLDTGGEVGAGDGPLQKEFTVPGRTVRVLLGKAAKDSE